MKKTYYIVSITFVLMSVLFCVNSCERPEIKPGESEVPTSPTSASVSYPADWLIGTWVQYSETEKDTLRFSQDGTLVYTLGDFYSVGEDYTKEYLYECTDNYLIIFNNLSDWNHGTCYIEFTEDRTICLIHDFNILHPGAVEGTTCFSMYFKKIDR